MQIKGRLTVCDRCGAKVFSKCTGEGVTDGGYTRWNKFEDLPKGWNDYNFGKGHLCPDCSKEFQKLKSEFFKKECKQKNV